MTRTAHRPENFSNHPANRLTDAAYARGPMVCRHCGLLVDTVAKSMSDCPSVKRGRRHFLVAA
jgi:hypothetical protein